MEMIPKKREEKYQTLIVEGPDGCGKSTLLKEVVPPRWRSALPTEDYCLKAKKDPARVDREYMYAHVKYGLEQKVMAGKRIFDRGFPSTMVYQGLSIERLDELPQCIFPCLVYFVMPSIETIIERQKFRGDLAIGLNDRYTIQQIYDRYNGVSLALDRLPHIDVLIDHGPDAESLRDILDWVDLSCLNADDTKNRTASPRT